MVAGLPKTRTASEEDASGWPRPARAAPPCARTLAELVDRDSAAYDAVVGAFRLPKGTDEEKAARAAGHPGARCAPRPRRRSR